MKTTKDAIPPFGAATGYVPAKSPIEMMIDAATGYAEPIQRKPTKDERDAAAALAIDVLSDLRHYYPDVVKTRPTTWPTHLRNTIAMKVAVLLAEHNVKVSDAPDSAAPNRNQSHEKSQD